MDFPVSTTKAKNSRIFSRENNSQPGIVYSEKKIFKEQSWNKDFYTWKKLRIYHHEISAEKELLKDIFQEKENEFWKSEMQER